MKPERSLVNDEGELMQGLNTFLDASADTSSLIHDQALANKQREEAMLGLMKNLETVPDLYRTVGRGKDRLVVCRIPFEAAGRGMGAKGFSPDYLIFSKSGFFGVQGEVHYQEGYVVGLQNPLNFANYRYFISDKKEELFFEAVVMGFKRNRVRERLKIGFEYEIKDGVKVPVRVAIGVVDFRGKPINRSWNHATLGIYPLSSEEAQKRFFEIQEKINEVYGRATKRDSGVAGVAFNLSDEQKKKKR